jgi:chaperonin GroEL
MLLTTECVIAEIKEDTPSPMPPSMGGGGMPGMM